MHAKRIAGNDPSTRQWISELRALDKISAPLAWAQAENFPLFNTLVTTVCLGVHGFNMSGRHGKFLTLPKAPPG